MLGGDGGDMGEQPDDQNMPEGDADGEKDSTFFLPPEFTSKYDCQPGDKITLQVVSIDKDGDKEVKITGVDHGGKSGGMSMLDDLRANKSKIMPDDSDEMPA